MPEYHHDQTNATPIPRHIHRILKVRLRLLERRSQLRARLRAGESALRTTQARLERVSKLLELELSAHEAGRASPIEVRPRDERSGDNSW
ncbi:MAG TPA: hypothetical protein VK714_02875 [Myxococcota bacterium]|nr:hypothetical protein [Myxococcota bacterium]